VSPQETDADVAAWLGPRVGRGDVVCVQTHGSGRDDAYGRLQVGGVEVLRVSPYRCELPRRRGPAHDLIRAAVRGDLDVLVSTSAPAVRNLLVLAGEIGAREELVAALSGRVAVAAVGPVTARAFEDAGIPVAVMPQRFRTGDLLRALDGWARRRGEEPAPSRERIELLPEARAARVGARTVALGEREFAVLASLVRRPGIVCPPDLLARETWGHLAPTGTADVKHHISRLRRKLGGSGGALQTVRGVGYRYAPGGAEGPTRR
jgi:uroporphyrinogen-III synthase